MLNLLVHTHIYDPMTPAYYRLLVMDDCTGGDLSCVLDVTLISIRPEWDRTEVRKEA